MKVLTPEQEAAHYNATLKGGAIGGVAGVALGTAGVYAASVRYPAFRGLTLPFRVFLIASTGTFASIVSADRYSRAFETDQWGGKEYRDEQKAMHDEIDSQKSTKQKSMEWLQDNRYSIVFGSWVVSMGAALGIVGQSRWLTTQQKLVQARVYAQGFTIAAVIISLAFEGNDRMAGSGRWETIKIRDPDDPDHKVIEKRIHHEKYKGEDQWMDMVEAEERRIKEREHAVKDREAKTQKKDAHKHDKHHASEELSKGDPKDSVDKKLRAP